MPARNAIAAMLAAAVSAKTYSGNGPTVKDGDGKTVMDTSFSYAFSSDDTSVSTTYSTKITMASDAALGVGNELETCVPANVTSSYKYTCFKNSWYDGTY